MEILIFSIIGIILAFNLFVVILKIKIKILENIIFDLFKKRNYQVVSIYPRSQKYVIKHEEVFKNFLELKRRDFSENMHYIPLKEKIPTYKKIHNEINFIFKVCEKHNKLKKDAIYNYTKESLLEKSSIIGEKYSIYKKINKKYEKLLFISKFSLVGFLIGK